MNREIKFRAWNKELKKMCYDNEDDSAGYWDGCNSSNISMINHLLKFDKNDRYIYMQYTGLKDAGKVDIYEGDILQLNDDILIVEWDECGFVYRDDNVIVHQLEDIADISSVIGNIYELEKGEDSD